ncbi:MAG: transposase [Bacteroidales bacterium]
MNKSPSTGFITRKRLRLPAYDYSLVGAYYVTLRANDGAMLFGSAEDAEMHLNAAGRMVFSTCIEMPDHYDGVGLDVFCVMPNHVHAIVVIGDAHPWMASLEDGRAASVGCAPPSGCRGEARPSVPVLMQRFKSLTTTRYMCGVAQQGWVRFAGRLWQRSYYEHVIRDDDSLDEIRRYIIENPLRWQLDPENPDCKRSR